MEERAKENRREREGKEGSQIEESYALNHTLVYDHQDNWLAQLVEHRTALWKVEGSSPRPDQLSGS